MPHMGIEYSANLDAKVEMSELCALVSRIILETGLFEPGAERVRAFRADAYAVADRLPENGFIDMIFRIGRGRSAEEKKRTGEAIIKGLSRAFYVDTLGLQVSDETSDAIYLRALEERGHPSPREADLRWIGAIVSRNGEVEETGLGAGVLDHPAKGIVWLADRLHQYGMQIEAGQVVLSGSFIRPVECRHGDRIVSDFGPFGAIRIAFA
ncbi:hypothetical protein [Mesorhizobium sp.]|uniref:hypothetical protein n=1 Tax=Mesorhizobium sp. TaxID=1871066 RepID=UPI00121646A0|nr:hypothetical protein [Mesorhizobium sp.]TIN35660.1 MAG: hypothetical protein E5Y25_24560 [Mesorhizobium sp.]